MQPLRVAIAGATGYAGEELVRLLRQHPSVSLTALAASAKREQPVSFGKLFPRFAGLIDLPIVSLEPEALAHAADVVFLALPHGVSMDVAPSLLDRGRKVVDLGGDFRLKDAVQFELWYGRTHTRPDFLPRAAYGIPELFRAEIAKASFIANPGCYATTVILALAPLLKADVIDLSWIAVDAKSGLTGAGRKAEPHLMFSEIDENMWPYRVGKHQHTPEIVQALSPFVRGRDVHLFFVPQVVPLNRGMLTNVYVTLTRPLTWEDADAIFRDFYREAPFVRVRPKETWPQVRDVQHTNFCDIAFAVDADSHHAVIFSAIDNLTKGAAGQAVQNLNVMAGFPETAGLLTC